MPFFCLLTAIEKKPANVKLKTFFAFLQKA
jgi:hypothetical protein